MDFKDRHFGGQDNKDRTVPPEENYYANESFDFEKFRRKNFDYNNDLISYDEDTQRERKKSNDFDDVYSSASRNEYDDYVNDYSKRLSDYERKKPSYNNNIYSSLEIRRSIEDFDHPRASRDNQRGQTQRIYQNRYDEISQFEQDEGFSQSRQEQRDYQRTPNQRNPQLKAQKKRKKKKRILVAVLSVILVFALIVTSTGFIALLRINYNEHTENRYVNSADLMYSSAVTNILLLGVDARESESGNSSRSDTMLLVSIDTENNSIKMTSFLRDSWVYIPCRDTYQRLNAACSYGGYSAVADTIEYNFSVKIDGYVVADFEMFKVMVDCLGGVKIDVTQEEANEVTNHPGRYGNVTLEEGKNKLSGEQALAYCRIRKIDTDWKRTERQRTVMQAIIKKAIFSPLSTLKMISSIAEYIETDLSMSDIIGLAFKVSGSITGGFEQTACPFDETWEYATRNGASVIALNVEKNKQKLIEFIYEEE